MTKIKKFNEINESISFKTIKDSRGFEWEQFQLNDLLVNTDVVLVNFSIENVDDKDQLLKISNEENQKTTINNKQFNIKTVYSSGDYPYEIGLLIFNNDEPVYFIIIYEPHGFSSIPEKNMITFYGHEEIINLWLDDGYYKVIHTR